MAKKLYHVNCRGMKSGDAPHGIAFVVAEDASEAYQKVREYLDDKDLGFDKDRELESVELIADAEEYPDCGIRLYL